MAGLIKLDSNITPLEGGYFYLRYLTFCLPSKSRKEQFRPAYCHLLDCFICKYFIRNKKLIKSSRYRDELGSNQIKFFLIFFEENLSGFRNFENLVE